VHAYIKYKAPNTFTSKFTQRIVIFSGKIVKNNDKSVLLLDNCQR